MGDLSPHFSRDEFRDHHTGELVGPSPRLLAMLESIRDRIGRPLPIVSGYRSKTTNRAVGGAARSYHLSGRAADLPHGRVPVATAVAAGAGGIGACEGWAVHLDDRRTPSAVIFADCPKHGR